MQFTASASSAKAKSSRKVNKVDKYGRPLEASAKSNELKRYYRMEEPEVNADVDEEQDEAEKESEEGQDSDDGEDQEVNPEKALMDRARGIGGEESSDEGSNSDSDSEGSVTLAPSTLLRHRASLSRSPSIDLSESGNPFDLGSQADDSEGEPAVDVTKRIAIVNMDWDHLRATDLYRVLASSLSAAALPIPAPPRPSKNPNKKFDEQGNEIGPYKPASRLNLAQGRLLSLKIYPSKFGTERMEQETREGPPIAVFAGGGAGNGHSDDDEESTKSKRKKSSKKARLGHDSEDEITEKDIIREQLEEGAENYDGEALRRYQLERLRQVASLPPRSCRKKLT